MKAEVKRYSFKEEVFNALSHGLGIVFGVVALTILLYFSIKKNDLNGIVGFSIYGGSLIFMYLSSTLYHSIPFHKVKKILRVFDHSSIFIFIAGTFTPIALITLKGRLRFLSLGLMWGFAILGIIFKIITYKKIDKYKLLSLGFYIGMGWVVIFILKPIIKFTSIKFVLYLALGGLIYTAGTYFYSNKKIPYNHGIWHLFVLSGTICHFLGIYKYLL